MQKGKLEENTHVCPYCDHHFPLPSAQRMELLVDQGLLEERDQYLCSTDPLEFKDKKSYRERLQLSRERTGRGEGTISGTGTICGQRASIVIMDFSFMGGSMGVACGEKIARAMEQALAEKMGCVVVSCSGGARMQEGILSLMQMAKVSATRMCLKRQGLPFISVLTDPTTGGCAASFAMQGDINLAEPNALVGFAGPRVIEQSIRQILPEGFQRSEFLLEHGLLDRIVHRQSLKGEVGFFLKFLAAQA